MIRVCEESLEQLKLAGINVFSYSRKALQPKWLHVGVGAFHRSHQALLASKANNLGANFGIVGFEFLSVDVCEKLKLQDFLYTVTELDPVNPQTWLSGSIVSVSCDIDKFVSLLAKDSTEIVTLTITPSGYFFDASGNFDWERYQTGKDFCIYPYILEGLKIRQESGGKSLVFIPCDNVFQNGEVFYRCLTEFAERSRVLSRDLIASTIICASSVVDRITPQPNEEFIKHFLESKGIRDLSPVFCEKYCSWIIESKAKERLSEFEDLPEVRFVASIEMYERQKLYVLNLGHFVIGVLGKLFGKEFCHEVLEDPRLWVFLERIIFYEVFPAVGLLEEKGAYQYAYDCIQRFKNTSLRDPVDRLRRRPEEKLKNLIFPCLNASKIKQARNNNLCLFVALCLADAELLGLSANFRWETFVSDEVRDKISTKVNLINQVGLERAIMSEL